MRNFMRGTMVFGCLSSLACCTAIPEIPPDHTLPLREILTHATCELRFAFQELDKPEFGAFRARQWLVSVALTPKVDREGTVSAGLTGKSTSVVGATLFNSWTIGTAPGAQINVKGHRDGSVSYLVRSSSLIDKRRFPLECDPSVPSYHALSEHLGIREWLQRTVLAMSSEASSFVRLDKPTYSSQIFIKYNGSGSFTYNYPFGTDFASIGGAYSREETLSITMTPDPPKLVVRTLPSGGDFGRSEPVAVSSRASADALNRLDQLQLEQTLKNLQIRIQP